MSLVRGLLLTVAFAVELGVLVGVGVLGFHRSGALAWVLGLGLPVLFAVLWGVFGAPKAGVPLTGAADVGFRVVWFGCGAAALWLAGRPVAGSVLAVVWAVDSLLLLVVGR